MFVYGTTNTNLISQLVTERYAELLREAQSARLARAIVQEATARERTQPSFLARLRHLVHLPSPGSIAAAKVNG